MELKEISGVMENKIKKLSSFLILLQTARKTFIILRQ